MRLFLTFITLLTFLISADDHEQPKFEGLLSSEVFALDGGMELYVEKELHVMLVPPQSTFTQQLGHLSMS